MSQHFGYHWILAEAQLGQLTGDPLEWPIRDQWANSNWLMDISNWDFISNFIFQNVFFQTIFFQTVYLQMLILQYLFFLHFVNRMSKRVSQLQKPSSTASGRAPCWQVEYNYWTELGVSMIDICNTSILTYILCLKIITQST